MSSNLVRGWEVVIGLETHTQLSTESKIFSGASTRFGAEPNTQASPVDLALPGTLPVANRGAVERAIRFGLAVNAKIAPLSIFARKNYFYPDLPKGYQISQYDRPLATGGVLEYDTPSGARRVGITRVHMEEDAGKSIHDGFPDADRATGVDFNRSGVPLIEIVTEPDMRSAIEASAFFSRLREILVALGVNDGNMEEGSLRCDVNVSLRPAGSTGLGVKTEIKNVNSFRHVQHAIEFEIERQVPLLDQGIAVVQETRLWDAASGRTIPMRSKEDAHDYRYFPEPDLPPLQLDAAWVASIAETLPELPDARRRRFVEQYGLPEYDAGVLTQSVALAAYFEAVAAAAGNAKAASNWVMGELSRRLNELGTRVENAGVTAEALGGLIRLVESGTISGPIAKEVFVKMYGSGRAAAEIVETEGLARIDDASAVERAVDDVLKANAKAVEQYRSGKGQTFGFLVGQVMKATGGKANPAIVNAIVRRKLDT
jgi:aspartyl-tRNA(Asn)/glutamyl-tRNA(Gln) amidotransferase subunit B